MTLLSIAVYLLAHVGIVHSDHTPLLTVKQVCLNSSMTTVNTFLNTLTTLSGVAVATNASFQRLDVSATSVVA